MKTLKIFIIISFLISCKNFNDSNSNNNDLQTKPKLFTEQEMFSSFFQKFMNDSLFQKKRISNQVKLYRYNEEDKLDVSLYSIDEFSFMDFKSDSLAHKKEFNKYGVETKVEKDSVTYYHLGIDNGIHTFYVFRKKIKDEWYLTSIHDYSN